MERPKGDTVVLAFVAGNLGGAIRDLLIGAVPQLRAQTGATSQLRWRQLKGRSSSLSVTMY